MTALSEVPTLLPSTGQRSAPLLISRLLVWSLALSAGIHLAVAYQHSPTGDHGRFFAAVGTAQGVLALLVSRSSRRRLWAAITLSAFVVATWLAAQTSLFPVITGPVVEQPVQAGPAVPAPSIFGDLFEDHHAGPTGHETGGAGAPHDPGRRRILTD